MSAKSKLPIPTVAPPPAGTAAFDDAVAAEVRRQLAAHGVLPEPKATDPEPMVLPPDLHRNRLIDAPAAAAMLGYSLAHFRRLYRAGKTPAPVRVNGRKVGWPASVLMDFVVPRQNVA